MNPEVQYISLSPEFFVSLNPERVSFGFQDLPEKLHLTLSFKKDSSDTNLHITKENGAKRKPKIAVAVADKTILTQQIETFGNSLFSLLYEPLNLRPRPKRYKLGYSDRAYFIRLDDLESNTSFAKVDKALKNIYWQHTILKGTRLKMKPSLLPALEKWASSRDAKDFFYLNLKPVFKYRFSELESGFLLAAEYTGQVFFHRGQAFKPRENALNDNILEELLGSEPARQLRTKFTMGIDKVFAAEDYLETEPFDDPLRLFEAKAK